MNQKKRRCKSEKSKIPAFYLYKISDLFPELIQNEKFIQLLPNNQDIINSMKQNQLQLHFKNVINQYKQNQLVQKLTKIIQQSQTQNRVFTKGQKKKIIYEYENNLFLLNNKKFNYQFQQVSKENERYLEKYQKIQKKLKQLQNSYKKQIIKYDDKLKRIRKKQIFFNVYNL